MSGKTSIGEACLAEKMSLLLLVTRFSGKCFNVLGPDILYPFLGAVDGAVCDHYGGSAGRISGPG